MGAAFEGGAEMARPQVGGREIIAPGIRCRDHATRKHGAKADRYFFIRHNVDGKRVEEGVGWASEGWTQKRVTLLLAEFAEAKRTGIGPTSLKAKREAERGAEEAAQKAKRLVAEAEAQQTRQEKTVSDLWDRYLKEVVAVENKPTTIKEKKRWWERRIKPAIGDLKLKDVTEEDVGAVVRSPLRLDDEGQVVGGKAEGANLYRLMHHLFSKALGWGLRPRALGNPLENVTSPKVPRRERLLAGGEVGALLKALDKAEAERTEHAQVVAAVRVAILTGARINEVLSLRWDFIRRDEMELHFPDTKSGFSRRPLSAEALKVIDGVDKMPGVSFVFRSVDEPKEALSYNTVEKAFRRIVKAAGVTGCTLHTIRHWFATMTANSVSNPRVGMALTGHKSHAAYMNYIHGDKEQARALADQLAALATGLGKAADEKVYPMQGRRKRP